MIPSSTIEDLAVRFAVDFRAPLNTTNDAPVTTLSLESYLILKPILRRHYDFETIKFSL